MSFETILTPELVQEYTSQGLWVDRTITDYLDEVAARTPGKTAFIDPRGQVSYGELKDQVDRCALGLLELGVEAGDVVSFQLPNWIEWVVVHYAASRIGAISNPLIPIYRHREVGFMVGLARSKVLVVPSRFRGFDYVAMVDDLRGDWPALEHVLVVDGEAGQGTGSWEDFMATAWESRRDPATRPALRPDLNEVTLLIFTSGTTGEPKGVMHTHNTVVAANHPRPERLGITADTVFHMASTLAHLTGFLYGARLNVQNGATCVFQDVWDAETFVELVERHGITYTSAATPFLLDTLNAANLAEHDMSSLTRFCCMGAPIPRALVREAREKLPGLVVLGGALFVGYAERLEMTRAAFEGRWFDTGDLARIDGDGYVNISGRTKDVIIRGGENIPVSYVENVLYENPKLDSVAIVAVPDPRLQERACACVILKPDAHGFGFEEMQRFLADKGVAKQYWPEQLEILPDFPKTPSGKIRKFELRDQINAGGA